MFRNLEKELRDYKKIYPIAPKEQNINETVQKAIHLFCCAEQEEHLTYIEFLWEQLLRIRKRWWCFQMALLFLVWAAMPFLESMQIIQRALGVCASMFVILIIPELWKSRTCQTMEIEAVSYYSLRQIYASRMLLFCAADSLLIALFCGLSSAVWNMALSQLLVQFMFPMTVTACICFGILCSKYPFGETTAIVLCTLWSIVWMLLILDETVYTAIAFPLWLLFWGMALCFLLFAVYRILYHCNQCWEENYNGIGLE